MKRGKAWTPEEEAILTEMWLKDISVNEIAIRTGRTCAAVYQHKKKLGLLSRMGKYESGWTPEMDAIVKTMWSAGEPIDVIGECVGRSASAAYHRAVDKLGLSVRADKRPHATWRPYSRPRADRILLSCLCCGRQFRSWDRTRNRLCNWCSKRDEGPPDLTLDLKSAAIPTQPLGLISGS